MITTQYRDLGPDHEIYATLNGGTVGSLIWSKKTNRVRIVWVHPEHRRKGIATSLWEYAQTLSVPAPKHSRDRTADGREWVASLSLSST